MGGQVGVFEGFMGFMGVYGGLWGSDRGFSGFLQGISWPALNRGG